MAEAAIGRERGVPWTLRLCQNAPVSPGGVAALTTVGFVALAWAYGHFMGFEGPTPGMAAFEVLGAVLIGYGLTIPMHAVSGSRREFRTLRASLDCTDQQFEERLDGFDTFDRLNVFWWGSGFLVAGLLITWLGPGWEGGRPALTDPALHWTWVRNGLAFWCFGIAGYTDVVMMLRFSDAGRAWARVDLLDLSPLRPFVRRGLRSVLLWMGAAALVAIQSLVAPWPSDIGIGLALLLLAIALAALLLPVFGVHRRIVATRETELDRVRAAIREERDANLAHGGATDARLANLVAWESRVASVVSWPFDVTTWLRFGLYLSLGLGSWLGAALVERALDTVFE